MKRLTSLFNLQLTVGVLRGLDERKVTIAITNQNIFYWSNLSTLAVSGTILHNNLPVNIPHGKSEFCKCIGTLV